MKLRWIFSVTALFYQYEQMLLQLDKFHCGQSSALKSNPLKKIQQKVMETDLTQRGRALSSSLLGQAIPTRYSLEPTFHLQWSRREWQGPWRSSILSPQSGQGVKTPPRVPTTTPNCKEVKWPSCMWRGSQWTVLVSVCKLAWFCPSSLPILKVSQRKETQGDESESKKLSRWWSGPLCVLGSCPRRLPWDWTGLRGLEDGAWSPAGWTQPRARRQGLQRWGP